MCAHDRSPAATNALWMVKSPTQHMKVVLNKNHCRSALPEAFLKTGRTLLSTTTTTRTTAKDALRHRGGGEPTCFLSRHAFSEIAALFSASPNSSCVQSVPQQKLRGQPRRVWVVLVAVGGEAGRWRHPNIARCAGRRHAERRHARSRGSMQERVPEQQCRTFGAIHSVSYIRCGVSGG